MRLASEVVCSIDGFDISGEPIINEPYSPLPLAPTKPAQKTRLCQSGHNVPGDDELCPVCGADIAPDRAPFPQSNLPDGGARGFAEEEQAPYVPDSPSLVIGDWRVMESFHSQVGAVECHRVKRTVDAFEAVLTLYPPGVTFDAKVYETLPNLRTGHAANIIGSGLWEDRLFEIRECFPLGDLSTVALVVDQDQSLRAIVEELGRAIHAINSAGIRHRALQTKNVLVRSLQPLDLVIDGFGSARTSDFDLDTAPVAYTTFYTAPEVIAGAVSPASDWWSLGMILLDKATGGRCFEGINEKAFRIHIVMGEAPVPDDLHPDLNVLLRGLLTKDLSTRWQWKQVRAWLAGETLEAPAFSSMPSSESTREILLGGKSYRSLPRYALAAANEQNWNEAVDQLRSGEISAWVEEACGVPAILASLRNLSRRDVDDDFRLSIALRLLHPSMPLILRGEIINAAWLLQNPLQGYEFIIGPLPEILNDFELEPEFLRLKRREAAVRERAASHRIELSMDDLRIAALGSRARLAALWETKRRLSPDTEHAGLAGITRRASLTEEDLIILVCAEIGQFIPISDILAEAEELVRENNLGRFDREAAQKLLEKYVKRDFFRLVDQRIADFARCGQTRADDWADQFRQESRMPLARALALLTVPPERWKKPEGLAYITSLTSFFEQKLTVSIKRGPLARMTVAKTSTRFDLHEIGSDLAPAERILNGLLDQSGASSNIDPEVFRKNPLLEGRLLRLVSDANLYKRDTGIDGLYLGFPFIVHQAPGSTNKPRISPVLLWPVKLVVPTGQRGISSISFDKDRHEVRINPALEGFLGQDEVAKWKDAAEEFRGAGATAAGVIDALSIFASQASREFMPLPSPDTTVKEGRPTLVCSAVVFNATYMGQALVEDLRQLKHRKADNTARDLCLRLGTSPNSATTAGKLRETDKFIVAESDASQEDAIFRARNGAGLLIEGPPGTGKSQTIVNMIADAIGCGKSLLFVCQKQPALDVVYKRLIEEGLDGRVVLVKDVNKDRKPILTAIRDQINGNGQGGYSWRNDRIQTAALIETLESDIDKHHKILHAIDEASGRSYRTIISELIEFEAVGRPPIDVRGLRPVLGGLNLETLTLLEETCAPLGGLWLRSRFEDSPLAALKPFESDNATLEDFHSDFEVFKAAEQNRIAVLQTHPGQYEIEDAKSAKEWLAQNAAPLVAIDEQTRRNLRKWVGRFQPATGDKPAIQKASEALLEAFSAIKAVNRDHHDSALFGVLLKLDDVMLGRWIAIATKCTAPTSFFARLNPALHIPRRKLRRFLADNGVHPTAEAMVSFLRASQLEKALRPIRASVMLSGEMLGESPDNCADKPSFHVKTLIVEALTAINEVVKIHTVLKAAPHPQEALVAARKGTVEAINQLLAEYQAALLRHRARAESLATTDALKQWFDDRWIVGASQRIHSNQSNELEISAIEDSASSLAPYQDFRARSNGLSELGWMVFKTMRKAQKVLDALPPSEIDREIRRIIGREARLAWKERIERANPVLRAGRTDLEAKAKSLGEALNKMRELNRKALAQGPTLAPSANVQRWEDITRLQGPRAIGLRDFFDKGLDLGLQKLRPVWMMNPDVASRMLPLKPGSFDYIVFDEASQIPVENALPALYRGKKLIVSGDEKQLPPSSFFSETVDDKENESEEDPFKEDLSEEERDVAEENWNRREIKDCPDLLHLARAALPEDGKAMLQVHYRSQWRELIAFSNAAFYDNRLNVPVQHPDALVEQSRPIDVRRVDGLYLNQANRDEALAVIDVLAGMWLGARRSAQVPSVGVVTFNRKQADLIEELIGERAKTDEAFNSAYVRESNRAGAGGDAGFFVKNVENVQGDERDVIIFSTTFGRNVQGRFIRNFGVLGQAGGERRLNVAITRAKEKIIIVTSMPVPEISNWLGSRRKPEGPRDFLQAFMQYAAMISSGDLEGARALLIQVSRSPSEILRKNVEARNSFGDIVASFLRNNGFEPIAVNDGDAFGIDYAIADPSTGLFAIGIECDSPDHPLLATARARELWRTDILKKSVRHVHRISVRDWYHTRQFEEARLLDAVRSTLFQKAAE